MDPISDMFIRIKNAQRADQESVQIPYSKFKHEIVKALERSGFIGKVERKGKRLRRVLNLKLLYENDMPKIRDVRLISVPSRRLYTGFRTLRSSRRGGIILVSTPKGVMTDREAKKAKVGGQLLAEIW